MATAAHSVPLKSTDTFMKKNILVLLMLIAGFSGRAQENKKPKVDLSSRPNDHFIIQMTSDSWLNTPDSIDSHMSGFHRGLNIYLMLDKPFKSNPKLSFGFGAGISSSNMYFENMLVNVAGTSTTLQFQETDSTGSYQKYKLNTTYLEAPVELRFSSKPEHPNKSIKLALGIKAATLLSAHTKGKNLKTSSGSTLLSGIEKQSSKKYFNPTRLAATFRINYGIFGITASYALTPLLKNGVGSQDIRQMQIGLTLSGL